MLLSKRFFLKNFVFFSCIPLISNLYTSKVFKGIGYYLLSQKFFTMGTVGKICILTKCIDDIYLLENAINMILCLEKKLTKFSIDSEIGKLNSLRTEILVSDNSLNILKLCSFMQRKTNNYFNVALDPIFTSLCKLNFFNPIQLSPKNDIFFFNDRKVSLTQQRYIIDLGGIGKGYIIQNVMNFLINSGVKHVCIEIGGDVKVYGGLPYGKLWEIILDGYGTINKIVKLHTGGVSTSGNFTRRFGAVLNKINILQHIVDPTTSSFRNYYNRVTVIGIDLSICDSLSTACYNVPTQCLNEFINSFSGYVFDIN